MAITAMVAARVTSSMPKPGYTSMKPLGSSGPSFKRKRSATKFPAAAAPVRMRRVLTFICELVRCATHHAPRRFESSHNALSASQAQKTRNPCEKSNTLPAAG